MAIHYKQGISVATNAVKDIPDADIAHWHKVCVRGLDPWSVSSSEQDYAYTTDEHVLNGLLFTVEFEIGTLAQGRTGHYFGVCVTHSNPDKTAVLRVFDTDIVSGEFREIAGVCRDFAYDSDAKISAFKAVWSSSPQSLEWAHHLAVLIGEE